MTAITPSNDVPPAIAAAGRGACAAWGEFIAGDGLRPSTRKLYRNHARQFLAWLEPRSISLAAVMPATVESYLDSQASCAHERAIFRTPLRRLFAALMAHQAIPSNPAGPVPAAATSGQPSTVVAPKPSVRDGARTPGGAFENLLPDDAAAALYLESLRWPDGITCPSCGHGHIYRGHPRKGRHGLRRGLNRCAACGRQFTATAGTALGGGKLGPRALLLALASLHVGESLLQTSKRAGITYKTAQQLRQRIAEHPHDPLIGKIKAALDGLVSPEAVGADAQPSLSTQPPAGPPSLAEMQAAIRELDPPAMADAPEMLDAGVVLLAGLHLGTKEIMPISRFTGVARKRVTEFAERLRANGVWLPDGRTAANWNQEGGELALLIDILIAVGMVECCPAEAGPSVAGS